MSEENKVEDKILVKFVRNRKNHPVGVVVAVGSNQIGWSLASKMDRIPSLDRERAVDIAIKRALERKSEDLVPRSIKIEYNKMLDRASHYFK